MDSPRKIRMIADGVTFSSILDDRFKTNRISVHLITQLQKDTVTVNALIPQVLKKGFRGCEDYTVLNQRLQSLYGAYLDADVQKRGDDQILSVSITVIDDRFVLPSEAGKEQEHVAAMAAEIVCDMTLHPLVEDGGFRKAYIDLEKNALIDTIEAEINEKRSYAVKRLTRTMCDGEPYGLPKYGFRDQVDGITPQNALKQYQELLRTAQIEIMFTGSGDANAVCQVFEEAFQSLERSCRVLPPVLAHPVREGDVRRETETMSVSQSKLVMGFACGEGAEGKQIPAYRLMAAILGGTPSSKLFLNVREKLSLCYYCAARYDVFKGLMLIDSGVENQNVERAEKEILAQLEAIGNGDITDKEYDSALLSLKNAYSTIYESDTTVENFYLGQLLSGQESTPELEKQKLEQLTREDVIAAAKRMRLDTVYLLTGGEKGETENG